MTTNQKPKSGLKILGIGALACVGCCAGPVLAFFGGLSIAGLASTTLLGGTGLIIAAAAALAYVLVRRRRTLACAVTYPDAVAMPDPTRRNTPESREVTTP